MLAPMDNSRSSTRNGGSSACRIFSATTWQSPSWCTSGITTTNSSPPWRASVSALRTQPAMRRLAQHGVAGAVAERVVDLLEAVQVDHHHRDARIAALREKHRLAQAVV